MKGKLKWAFWLLLIIGLLAFLLHLAEEKGLKVFSPSPAIRLLMAQKAKVYQVEGRLTGEVSEEALGKVFQLTSNSAVLKVTRKSNHFLVGGLILEQDRVFLEWEKEVEHSRGKGRLELVAGKGEEFDVVLHQELEPYVAGVVMAEMKPHWALESLKAQAICARSYAWFHVKRHRRRHYDLWGNSRSQAFSHNPPTEKVRQAVMNTLGKVLSYQGKVVMAYYMSTCGGKTRTHSLEGVPYASVECGFCIASPHYHWEVTLPGEAMKRLVSKGVDPKATIESVEVIAEDSGHAIKLRVNPDQGASIAVDALTFRRHLNRALGKEALKSLVFSVEKNRSGWLIKGRGWGYHGRGLCQYGAKGMGDQRQTSDQILQHYYPSFSVIPLP